MLIVSTFFHIFLRSFVVSKSNELSLTSINPSFAYSQAFCKKKREQISPDILISRETIFFSKECHQQWNTISGDKFFSGYTLCKNNPYYNILQNILNVVPFWVQMDFCESYGMSGQSSRSGKVLILPSGSGKEKDQSGFWDFWISKVKSKSSRSQSQSKVLTHPSGSGKEKEQSVPFSFVLIVDGDEEWGELWHQSWDW